MALALALLWHPAFASLALDGSTGLYGNVVSSVTLTLTTSSANDVIEVGAEANATSGTITISSVTATGLTFTQRSHVSPLANQIVDVWYAKASSALSSVAITVNFSQSTNFYVATAFGISGANTASPFDTNASVPVANTAAADPTISTSNANDFIFGVMRFSTGASPTAGTGWTAIYNPATKYFLAEYKIVSATQSGLSIAVGTGTGTENGSIGDAIVQAGAVASSASQFFLCN